MMKLSSSELELCMSLIREMYEFQFTNTTKELKNLIEEEFTDCTCEEQDLEKYCFTEAEEQILIYKQV